ncbi:PaaI family thioesterase [Nocardiopsis composta]|uniref:Uncharacterized protein (TIGR00369 family) n=1 Tax=Nocardiopsis composta TaxID=157465 RepID=A0A7W8VBD5_9ACTN|nr:PaaI family thioesterase [Nocardiopsis composta]MBB5430032.1 uncharacterized protein (TIGR00369 family) [Nocardiopsis composta]
MGDTRAPADQAGRSGQSGKAGRGGPGGAGALLEEIPFAAGLGARLTSAGPDRVVGELDHAPGLCTAGGVLHGGALMSLADTAGAVCAFLNLPDGAATATVESGTRFFRGVREGTVRAVAVPRHVGRSTIAVRVELFDSAGRLVGETAQTQAVLGRPAPRKSETD